MAPPSAAVPPPAELLVKAGRLSSVTVVADRMAQPLPPDEFVLKTTARSTLLPELSDTPSALIAPPSPPAWLALNVTAPTSVTASAANTPPPPPSAMLLLTVVWLGELVPI